MTIDIAGVPTSIPRSKVEAFLRDLGLEVIDDLREFHCGVDGVYLEYLARDGAGKHYLAPGSDEIAVHRISVPLDWEA